MKAEGQDKKKGWGLFKLCLNKKSRVKPLDKWCFICTWKQLRLQVINIRIRGKETGPKQSPVGHHTLNFEVQDIIPAISTILILFSR